MSTLFDPALDALKIDFNIRCVDVIKFYSITDLFRRFHALYKFFTGQCCFNRKISTF